ncbi:MAG: AglZ/HisF2 family acetamidino modification protein [Rhizomicrobium sp.]
MSTPLPPLQLPPLRPRVIPVLLLKDGLLYKPRAFKNPVYVGDPRVAVKIFNDKGADEIALLDMTATAEAREPDYQLIEEIASESFMPLAYGGGVRTVEQARRISNLGVEKIILNTVALEKPDVVSAVSALVGASSTVVCIDYRKQFLSSNRVYAESGKRKTEHEPVGFARAMAAAGAGEIILQDVDREGSMGGYNTAMIKAVAEAIDVPVVALGGAGNVAHFREATDAGAAAAAAGSMFVFQGPHRAVLITYPTEQKLDATFFGDMPGKA